MKKILILFGIIFSVFLFPKDVFAAGEDLYIPYYNKVEDFDILSGEGEQIKNILYNQSVVQKDNNDKCVLIYDYNNNAPYLLLCSPNISNLYYSYSSDNNTFFLSINDVKRYRFNLDYVNTYSSLSSTYNLILSSNSFENVILYSDVSFRFNINGVNTVYMYDINYSSKIFGTFKESELYSYKDFYLSDSKDDVVVFQDNDFHSISKLILGESIPDEYSFVYTISDYLLILILVGIIISPIAIIIKIMRW